MIGSTTSLLRGALLALSAFVLVACDGIDNADRPKMVFEPDSVAFAQVAVGSTDVRTVIIVNDISDEEGAGGSTADLVITGYQIDGPDGVFTVGGLEEFPITIPPGGTYPIQVIYTAVSTAAAQGRIVFDANSENDDDEILELSTLELSGRLFVTPNPVDFGRVPEGSSSCLDVVVQNIGTSPVTVSNYTLVASSGEFTTNLFSEQFPEGAVTLQPAGAEGDRFDLEVCYTPSTDGFDSAALDFQSDAPQDGGRLRVPITANGAAPCIRLNHEGAFNFGPSLVNQTTTELFVITNCSNSTAGTGQDLIVSGISFTDEVFEISPAFTLPEAALPAMPITIPPGGTATFEVAYFPTALDVSDRTLLRVVSNDTAKTPLDVEITGVGSNNECPTAVARCSVGSGPPSDALNAVVLDTLTCTAAGSVDPDGTITEYIWEVIAQPADSTTTFETPNREVSDFFIDVQGSYTLQLTTVDDAGCASPSPAIVEVVANYDEDIAVQLVWETPADPDETDTDGSDVDLHFLHPSGSWTESQWDCHFRSVEPNWGSPSSGDDDPSLDIDDVDGAGPENINLDNPENGVTYRVGVHYWSDHGWGPADATVKIFIGGALVFEKTATLTNGQFWDVAAVKWPSGEIIVIDRIYASIDAAP
jgi:hypothetical protein